MLDEIKKDPELVYSDKFGRSSTEYISLGCDMLPVLCGRSPIQAYADFMRNFRDTFKPYFGIVITVGIFQTLWDQSDEDSGSLPLELDAHCSLCSFCREYKLVWVLVVN